MSFAGRAAVVDSITMTVGEFSGRRRKSLEEGSLQRKRW